MSVPRIVVVFSMCVASIHVHDTLDSEPDVAPALESVGAIAFFWSLQPIAVTATTAAIKHSPHPTVVLFFK
jgi:hypothetical protein